VIDQSPRLVTDTDWRYGIYYDWTPERDRQFLAQLRQDFVETVVRLIALGRNRKARERYELSTDGLWRLRAYLSTVDPDPLIRIWESLTAADYRPVLRRIDVPVLLVYGSESNYYGVETGEYVRDAVADARLIVYHGADHSPHLSDRMRFAADLKRFVEMLPLSS
jgi:pimeloyl-ACP methyl ester carboxylesterase